MIWRYDARHLDVRWRTIESNFSLLLNCTASPDSLVHMCRLSGSNCKPHTGENSNSLCRVIFWLKPWACRAPCAGCGSCSYKHPSQGQESLSEPGKSISIDHQNDVKDLRWKLSWDRAATWVEEPIGFVPADQVALWKLFTACNLKE